MKIRGMLVGADGVFREFEFEGDLRELERVEKVAENIKKAVRVLTSKAT